MKKLTDFKPLESVVLPVLGKLDATGLVLIVGPNSSGKTQLLHDLHLRISGEPRTLVVAEEIKIRKPEYEPFVECLRNEGYVTTFLDDAGTSQIRAQAPYLGTGQGAAQIQSNQAKTWYQSFAPSDSPTPRRRTEFLNYFGRMLVTVLFLERRLISLNQVGAFDYETEPPQNDLHALYINEAAKDELAQETNQAFSLAVWPDASRGKIVCLRVSDSPDIPSADERLSPQKMSEYRTAETEGDGFKSYVATCISLLLGRRPVCLIDEPEMCLHPPQAYSIGQFIGKVSASSENATFVATHSSQVLRGIIQKTSSLQIVRLTRNSGTFQAHLVPSEVLKDALERPTVRAETVLDGIFSQVVAVIEGDGDRTVYQAAWETISPEFQIDIHFAAVGGTGGIAETCKLYRTLQIPVAVVADLDIITDVGRFKRVLSVLTDDSITDNLCRRALEITNDIKSTPPEVDADAVRSKLQTVLESELDWSKDHDSDVREQLLRIARELDRMRRLKQGGVEVLDDKIRGKLKPLIDDCKRHGLFLVPVGELEGWLSEYEIGAPKQRKWAWANAAASLIRREAKSEGDIWDFIRDVGIYLKMALETESIGSAIVPEADVKLAVPHTPS